MGRLFLKETDVAKKCKFGFVGAGNMATAICAGLVRSGLAKAADIAASDPDAGRRDAFREATGVEAVADNSAACEAEVVVLAVKPQVMGAVLTEIGGRLTPDKLVISIAAGVPIAKIEAAGPKGMRVVRAMPNTPLLVGKGAVGLAANANAVGADMERAKRIFGSAGLVVEVKEELLHAVTAVSGSGPAYVFYFAEAMVRAGVEMGLSREDAVALAGQTIAGAGEMLVKTGEDAADLRRKVTSPGGTTEAAIKVLDTKGAAAALEEAMKAAMRRSVELGKK